VSGVQHSLGLGERWRVRNKLTRITEYSSSSDPLSVGEAIQSHLNVAPAPRNLIEAITHGEVIGFTLAAVRATLGFRTVLQRFPRLGHRKATRTHENFSGILFVRDPVKFIKLTNNLLHSRDRKLIALRNNLASLLLTCRGASGSSARLSLQRQSVSTVNGLIIILITHLILAIASEFSRESGTRFYLVYQSYLRL